MRRRPTWLASVVDRQGGIVLDRDTGEVVVLDRSARFTATIPLPTLAPSDEEGVRGELGELFAAAEDADRETPLRFTLHTTLEAIYRSSAVRNGIPHLVAGLSPAGAVDLLIHFSRPPREWHLFGQWLNHVQRRHQTLYEHVHLWGPFTALDDELKDVFFGLGLQLGITAGWSPTSPPLSHDGIPVEALQDLARYGFRVPLIYFVTASNLPEVHRAVQEALSANEHSGFALPAVYHHPEYEPARHDPAPLSADYAGLLAGIYRDFPHHDDIFFPLSDVFEAFSSGGWRGDAEVPARLRLLLLPAQGVCVFRQIPALATALVDWECLRSWQPPEIAPRILDFHRETFAWPGNAFCHPCPWRYLCGGVDSPSGHHSLGEMVQASACEYRKLFFELLARQKAEWMSHRMPTAGDFSAGEMVITEPTSEEAR